jgi:hypothetical protein
MILPEWIPEMVMVSGNWDYTLNLLYSIFKGDFKERPVKLENKLVWWDRRIDQESGLEEGFWHLISKDEINTNGEKDRLFDPRRAERLPWCAAIIKHPKDAEVRAWESIDHKGKTSIYLWLYQFDYVVIFQRRTTRKYGEIAFLKTAYYVEGKSSKNKLLKRYKHRIR